MPRICCVDGCHSREGTEISLLRCPKDENRYQRWKQALRFVNSHRNANMKPEQFNNKLRVCELHFCQESFMRNNVRTNLQYNAVPSLNLQKNSGGNSEITSVTTTKEVATQTNNTEDVLSSNKNGNFTTTTKEVATQTNSTEVLSSNKNVGTYMVDGLDRTRDVLDNALRVGYRLFDTAKMYGNETDIGKALKVLLPKHHLTRSDVFITTKLLPSDHGRKAYDAIKESLNKLDCEYIDLYLIHWPGAYGASSSKVPQMRSESWQQMIRAQKEGLVKNIGVSNYTVKHLKEFLDIPERSLPVVNQIEWHPYYHPYDVLDFCKDHGILVQAYMPLGSGSRSLLNDPQVSKIAEHLGKTNAQVILKWSLQQGVGVIPKAASTSHMENNFQLDFTLPEDAMNTLSNLKKRTKYDWDPELIA